MFVFELTESLPECLHLWRSSLQKLFRSLPVNALDNHSDSNLMGVKCRLVGLLLFLLDIYGAQQPDFHQSVQQLDDKAYRQVVVVGKFFSHIWQLVIFKTSNDTIQQVQGDKILVSARHDFQILLVLKLFVVLYGETHLCAYQNQQTSPL